MPPSRLAAVLLALATSSATVHADVLVQTIDFDYAWNLGAETLVADRFDDLGGTRELTRVTFEWDHVYEADYRMENTGPTAVAAEDYALSFSAQSIFQVGTGDGSPFFGFGGWFEDVAVALGATHGAPGGADEFVTTFSSGPVANVQEFTPDENPGFIGVMSGTGTFDSVLGEFAELFFGWINEPVGWDPSSGPFGSPVYPVDDAIWFFIDDSRHVGTLTITYEFDVIDTTDCSADFDLNGTIGFADLNQVLANWGACPFPCRWDLDGNGTVGFADLNELLAAWGACP